jgi:DNA-binding transcriptional LysR family regulator
MLNWDDLHYFVVLAREGTLSAAGRALGVDHVTVARRVARSSSSIAAPASIG